MDSSRNESGGYGDPALFGGAFTRTKLYAARTVTSDDSVAGSEQRNGSDSGTDRGYQQLAALLEEQNELLRKMLSVQTESGVRPEKDVSILSSGHTGQVETVVDDGQVYERSTHVKLFVVIDLLAGDRSARELSVRDLAQETGVSKSWCAIAKRYWANEEGTR